jgi:AraC family transcriptional regulator of arabinose operon
MIPKDSPMNNSIVMCHIKKSIYSDILVFNCGYEKASAKKEIRSLKDYGSYTMHYVLSGCGYLEINNRKFKVTRDEIFFISPDTPVKYYPDKNNPWKYCWINFMGTKAEEFLNRIDVSPGNPVIKIDHKSKIGKLFLQNVIDCLNNNDFSDIVATSYFYKIFAELSKLKTVSDHTEHSATVDIVNRALKFIAQNYSNPNLNIKIVASNVGIHESYLSRLIKSYTKLTFTTYLTNTRINAAVELIDMGNYFVSDVAYKSGFSDPYYFSKVFKKFNTISPRDHIKKIKVQNEIKSK